MSKMKNFIFGFLMLIMLTPSLACAMTYCPVQASKSADASSCHQSENETKVPMLVLDCMGIDLFQADTSNDIQPNLSFDTIDFAWNTLSSADDLYHGKTNAIRGPPNLDNAPLSPPSIIFTTQRFRI